MEPKDLREAGLKVTLPRVKILELLKLASSDTLVLKKCSKCYVMVAKKNWPSNGIPCVNAV